MYIPVVSLYAYLENFHKTVMIVLLNNSEADSYLSLKVWNDQKLFFFKHILIN